MTWHAVDAAGMDLSTGRPPCEPGWPTPAAALSAVPVPAWPLAVAGDDRRLTTAQALGPAGDRVAALLESLAGPVERDDGGDGAARLASLARLTPAGRLALPVDVVVLRAGVEAAARVDHEWLVAVGRARDEARAALVTAGRQAEMEAALHVTILLATERFDPADDADVDAHVASGARLWLLAGAVVSALSGRRPDPFEAWASLVVAGWWPVGPSGGRLVVSASDRARA